MTKEYIGSSGEYFKTRYNNQKSSQKPNKLHK